MNIIIYRNQQLAADSVATLVANAQAPKITFPTVTTAVNALSNFRGDQMVTIATLGECCCLLACVLNALRTLQERLAWVGGKERAISPTGFFEKFVGLQTMGTLAKM